MICGSASADSMTGNATQNNFFEGMAGNDTIIGGTISDSYHNVAIYESAPSGINAQVVDYAGTVVDGYSIDLDGTVISTQDSLTNINEVIGSHFDMIQLQRHHPMHQCYHSLHPAGPSNQL